MAFATLRLVKAVLSAAEARRIALAAQGFDRPRPRGRVDARHLRRVLEAVQLVQLDSVNTVVRAHYLPFFSRLGPYPLRALDDLAHRRRELFEYWGHEASLIPVRLEPLFRHRMAAWPRRRRIEALLKSDPGYAERVLEEVRERGPLASSDLDDPGERIGPWWGWGKGKTALEWHFARGALGVAARRNWTRHYDLRERVLPPHALERATPKPDDARRALLLLAARAHGLGTVGDLADYFRLPLQPSRPLLAELVAGGELEIVRVQGWREPAYLHPQARLPRRIEAAALISPFDSLVWARPRTERVFDFHYRIEIYTPAAERRYGYYVLPFLLGDRLVGRVDVRADRLRGALAVPAAHLEPGVTAAEAAPALAEELRSMAAWLALERVEVGTRGELAPALRKAVG